MKKFLLFAALFAIKTASAAIVYEDDFTGASISPVWNATAGNPVALDDPNDQLDYTHTAGTPRRFLNNGTILVSKTGYLKAAISNFSGAASIWFGFIGTNPANNTNYASTIITGNGTYELFFNNTAGSLPFDNGAGWSGTLASGESLWSTDGGSNSAALDVGSNIAVDTTVFGFGFANFGSTGVFPSSSFSIDSFTAGDSLVVSASGNTAPVVVITAPADGAMVNVGANVNFTGTANDLEEGDLSSSIAWSSSIGGNLVATGASINVSNLSIGVHTITASVTDGGALVGDDAITVTVTDPDNTPPSVTVTAPADNTTVTAGTSINFTGTASDTQDGDLSADLAWTSSIDGNIGSGASFNLSSLTVGTHTIIANATDNGLLTGSDAITLIVDFDSNAPRPNIIVIVSDDAGYADFGFMNGAGLSGEISAVPTPNLDALANRGITFSRAYVAANCQPTRAAMMTGAYQARIGNENVGNNHFRDDQIFEGIPVGVDTAWDRMKALGYTTGAIGKWHLGSVEDQPGQLGNRPQNQGIDEFYGFWHGSRDYLAGSYNESADPDNPLQLRYIREALILPDGSKTDTVVEYSKFANVPAAPKYITNILGDYAEQFVADHHADAEPFFLYVAHPAPHKPWTDESPDYDDPRITSLPLARRQVASMMITMDTEIGELMDQLDDPNGDGNTSDSIKNNTLVIFINDNGGVSGGGTNNGQLNGVKGSPFDGGICVPMIMAGAGIHPSKIDTVYNHPVHGIDILPTSVALAGGIVDPVADNIDGVNLIPFVNGTNTAAPHDLLVHRWRGTFSVIDDNWKLVNTNNTNANPNNYRLYDLDTDRGEATDLSGDTAHAARIESLQRALTDREAAWDKPRYPILARTLETEPLNIIDHFVFRPGIEADWSGGVPDADAPTTEPANWYEGGTTNPEHLFRSDGFSGAILEFPVHASDYTANNDLVRKTGMEFMLNKIILSGDFSGAAARTATITGNDLLFTADLAGNAPQIDLGVSESGASAFGYHIDLDLVLYHDLTLTGDGVGDLSINGAVSQYSSPRGLIKEGTCSVSVAGARSYSGDTSVHAGTLTLGQINAVDEASSISIAAAGATLDLGFAGTDVINQLFIGGVQQAAGVYEALGNPGGGNEIAQITGQGTLTVVADPVGYALWSGQNAPGQSFSEDHDFDEVMNGIEYFMGESGNSFTELPTLGSSHTLAWPISSNYVGSYGANYRFETSTDLFVWDPVAIGNVSVVTGTSVSYVLPSGLDELFVRLSVDAN